MELCQNMWYHKRTTLHWLCTQIFIFFLDIKSFWSRSFINAEHSNNVSIKELHFHAVPLDSCTHHRYWKSATWEGDIHKINETFEKSYLLIGLSKFAQTFAVWFLKSSSIHPIYIKSLGKLPFKLKCRRENDQYSRMSCTSNPKYNCKLPIKYHNILNHFFSDHKIPSYGLKGNRKANSCKQLQLKLHDLPASKMESLDTHTAILTKGRNSWKWHFL